MFLSFVPAGTVPADGAFGHAVGIWRGRDRRKAEGRIERDIPLKRAGQDGVACEGLGFIEQEAQHEIRKGILPMRRGRDNGADGCGVA